MEGIKHILYFDDYHAQTTAKGKMESLARLKSTLATLKKSKKYLSFRFTLEHLYHLVSLEKKKLEFCLRFITSIKKIEELRKRIYMYVGFPFSYVKNCYEKVAVVWKDELEGKKIGEIYPLLMDEKIKYCYALNMTQQEKEKLEKEFFEQNKKHKPKNICFLKEWYEFRFQAIVVPQLKPWVATLSDTTVETNFTAKQAEEKLTQLKAASVKLKEFQFKREVWNLPYKLAIKMWYLLKSYPICECDNLKKEIRDSLIMKAWFFLQITYDKSGNIEKQIAQQLDQGKKTSDLFELMERSTFKFIQEQLSDQKQVRSLKKRVYKRYAQKMQQLRAYEERKNQKKNLRLHDEPLQLSGNELQILAFKTVMDDPEKHVPFKGIEDEEIFFRRDLYFMIKEKGFEYCKKAYFHLIKDENKRLIQELGGVLEQLRKLYPKVI